MALKGTIRGLLSSLRKHPPQLTCSFCPPADLCPAPHRGTTHVYDVVLYFSSDTCGPVSPPSIQGNAHVLTFIDAASRYITLYFSKSRSHVQAAIPHFFLSAAYQLSLQPRIFRSDNAREYLSRAMQSFFNTHEITHLTRTPHQAQEKPLAERLNLTLVSTAPAYLHHSRLPPSFWEDALKDAAFQYNRIIYATTSMSLYQLWHHTSPPLGPRFLRLDN